MYVAGGVLQKEREESVCHGSDGFEEQLQDIRASLDECSSTVVLGGVEKSVSPSRCSSRCHGKAATSDGKWSVTLSGNLQPVGTRDLAAENTQNPSRNIACTEGKP